MRLQRVLLPYFFLRAPSCPQSANPFFHNSACTQTPFDELREGQAVTFERGQGPKGPRGENVRLA